MLTRAKSEPVARPKRFWKEVAAGPAGEGGFPVLLDGRPARTPAGRPLRLPTAALAGAVATEWAGSGEEVDYAAMPLTRLAFTAIDRTVDFHDETAEEVARYAGSDLLCYFAETPEALVERERVAWEPLLAWAEDEFGARFVRAAGVVHQPQPLETPARIAEIARGLDDFQLTGLAWATALYGSAVLGLALQRGRLSGEQAFDFSRIDEAFQEERWGVDEEAAERTAGLRAQAVALDRWFRALA